LRYSTIYNRRIIDLNLKKGQFVEEERIDALLNSLNLTRTNGRKAALDQDSIAEIHQEVKNLVGDGSAFKKALEAAMFERRKAIAMARGFKSKWVKPFGASTVNKYCDVIAPGTRDLQRLRAAKTVVPSKVTAERTKRKKKTTEVFEGVCSSRQIHRTVRK